MSRVSKNEEKSVPRLIRELEARDEVVEMLREALEGAADISIDFIPTDYPYRRQILLAREALAKAEARLKELEEGK
jgi:hypothetical protein